MAILVEAQSSRLMRRIFRQAIPDGRNGRELEVAGEYLVDTQVQGEGDRRRRRQFRVLLWVLVERKDSRPCRQSWS